MSMPLRGKSVDQLQIEVMQLKKAIEALQSAFQVDRAGNVVIKGKDIEIKAAGKLTLKGARVEGP